MTKQELIKYICENYSDIMLITHDEMMDMRKKDLELYSVQLKKQKEEE